MITFSVIKKSIFRFLLGTGMMVALLTSLPMTGTAQASSKPLCAVENITLHGTAAPTVTCQVKASSVSPSDIGVVPQCWSQSYLELFWNGPIGVHPNYLLCISGTGLLNLNQQLESSDYNFRNWNDQASAWWTGCSRVTFYKDINRGGASVTEPGSAYGMNSPQGIFPLGGIGNDQLSSVWLDYYPLC